MEDTGGINISQKNELQGHESINNSAVDELQVIVTPDEDTEEFITDLLDADLEGLEQGLRTHNCSSNQ